MKPTSFLFRLRTKHTVSTTSRQCNSEDNAEKFTNNSTRQGPNSPLPKIPNTKSYFHAFIRRLSRWISTIAAFFCSKRGLVQRIFRGVLFEIKLAKRAWIQESKRFEEELRQSDQGKRLRALVSQDSVDQGGEDVLTQNSNDVSSELQKQQSEIWNALGINTSVDEFELIISSEYKKNLVFHAGEIPFSNLQAKILSRKSVD
jgi:hypothetical protein